MCSLMFYEQKAWCLAHTLSFLCWQTMVWNKENNLGDITCLSVCLSVSVKAKKLCQLCKLQQTALSLCQQIVEIKMYQWRDSRKGSWEISKQFRWVLSSAMGTEVGMNNRERKQGGRRNRGGEIEESMRLEAGGIQSLILRFTIKSP